MGREMVVTRYKNPGKHLGLRLALVTDLHNCEHTTLIKLLREEHPDAILCAGDILERHEYGMSEWSAKKMDAVINSIGKQNCMEKIMWLLDRITEGTGRATEEEKDTAIYFLQLLPSIAPTFYSVGNHEWYFTDVDYQMFEEFGITLLDNADCEVRINGVEVRIGGLSTRYDLEWLKTFSEKHGYKILMCHHPEYYRKAIEGTALDTFDLIVAGHYHGGQWRVFNRSVYVPRTGLFMKNARGQFDRLIISAGTANTTRFPRYGNPCELVMIEILA